MIAHGSDWRLVEYVCCAGPGDKPFEEAHETTSIAAVVAGSFNYRAPNGRALLYPGAVLLGNHGTCFECGHDHSTGDRCIALQLEPGAFAEVAATAAGSSQYQFAMAMLPAASQTAQFVAECESLARRERPVASEEWALTSIERIVAAASGHRVSAAKISARDGRRVAAAMRPIEDHVSEPLGLAALAAIAGLSRYHFLRVFRAAVGMTPYQLVLDVRLRQAAVRLRTSQDAISTVAFDAGFGDLSTFNRRFRAVFGMTPQAWRTAGRGG